MWSKGAVLWHSKTGKSVRLGKSVVCKSRFVVLALVIFSSTIVIADRSSNGQRSHDQCPDEFSYFNKNSKVRGSLSAQCLLKARNVAGTQYLADDDLIPPWANLTLVQAGQKFATKNIGYMGVSHFFALIFENFVPDIKDVLISTGSSNTLERAVKRYTATATQVLLWYRNSVAIPEEREVLLTSLRNVRKLHLDGAFKSQPRLKDNGKYVDYRMFEMFKELRSQQPPSIVFDERFWEALEKDLLLSDIPEEKRKYPAWKNNTGTPISQFAQSLTQFSFAGLPILFHRELGMSHVTREELEGYIHLWAVLGHALGIKDEFNICMNSNFDESIKLFREILDSYFIPAMFQLDWRVRIQLGAYLDALQHMDQVISPRLIMFRFLRDIVKIRPWNLFRQMNAIQRMYLALIDSLMSNNLDANRFILNQGGMFFLDVNGYHHFGSNYRSDAGKSQGAFFTRENLVI